MITSKALTGTISVTMANGALNRNVPTLNFTLAQNAAGLDDQKTTVLHTASRTLPLGELTTPGLCYFRNLSTIYPVTFGTQLFLRLEGVVTTSGSATVTCESTTDLVAGMAIKGGGIPDGTTISSVTNATTFVMSANANATRPASNTLTGTVNLTGVSTTNGDATVTCASTTGLFAGMTVTGTGIPGATTVLSVTDSTHFELSANATATQTGGTLTVTTALAAVITKRFSKIVTCTSTAKLATGTIMSGVGIADVTKVASVTDSTTFVLDNAASASRGVAFAYGTAMVPHGATPPLGFGIIILSEGSIPMARAHGGSADVIPWIAES